MACSLSLREEELLSNKVREFPVLYDRNMKGYNEAHVIKHVWDAVADQLEFVEDGEKAQLLFTTVKKKYLRKKREWKEAQKLKVSMEVRERTERGFHTYIFLSWLDQYVQIRSLRKKYPLEDYISDDELTKPESVYSTHLTSSDTIKVLTPEYTESILSTSCKTVNNFSETSQETSSPQFFASLPPPTLAYSQKDNINIVAGRKRKNSYSDENGLDYKSDYRVYSGACVRRNERHKTQKDYPDSEDLFCKAIAIDLKELPYFEKCMAKSEIRNIISKYQIEAHKKSTLESNSKQHQVNLSSPSVFKKEPIAADTLENAHRPTMISMTSYSSNSKNSVN